MRPCHDINKGCGEGKRSEKEVGEQVNSMESASNARIVIETEGK